MSGSEVIALVAVVTSGIVGVAGIWFSFWNSNRERDLRLAERREDNREWYKRTLFENRIGALQEAKLWLNRLSDAMNDPGAANAAVTIEEALDWYQRNVLLIHGEMPETSPLGRFLYSTQASIDMGDDRLDFSMWQEASKFVREKANELVPRIDI